MNCKSDTNVEVITTNDNPYPFELRAISSVTMSLLGSTISDLAKDAIDHLAAQIFQATASRAKPGTAYIIALGAATADLLKATSHTPPRPCFRPMGAGSFTDGPIGYHAFKRVLDDLEREGFVERVSGTAPTRDTQGVVTRIIPSIRFTDFMARSGIHEMNRAVHFHYPAQWRAVDPIQLKAGRTFNRSWKKVAGKRLQVNFSEPLPALLADEVRTINQHIARNRFSFADDVTLFRGFNLGDQEGYAWNKGGRLYCHGGSYQSLSKEERQFITINDSKTVEMDISACHITIAHGLCETSLPNRSDLYDVEGVPRDVLKMFITLYLGQGKCPRMWTPDQRQRYNARDLDRLANEHPIQHVAKQAMVHLPVLGMVTERGLSWADFQFIESQVMVKTLLSLAKDHDICALPVHDSLIVPVEDAEQAKAILSHSFHQNCRVLPTINI